MVPFMNAYNALEENKKKVIKYFIKLAGHLN